MERPTRSRVAREEWSKRVERWRDSGLKCAEFAREIGVNPRTLTYWKWVLGREARGEMRMWPRKAGARARAGESKASPSAPIRVPELIEVEVAPRDGRFELELSSGRRLRVPARFDATELRRLLDVLEAP